MERRHQGGRHQNRLGLLATTALESYQDEVLSNRDAWQFTKQLTVRILRYEPGKSQVNVEMKTAGRMLGSTWLLDADALVQ